MGKGWRIYILHRTVFSNNLKIISKRATWNTSTNLDTTPTKVFKECHLSDVSGNSFEFSLVETKSIGVYGDKKKNENQKVVKSEDDVDKGFQQFLDNVQI